jgi:hypothetical protein
MEHFAGLDVSIKETSVCIVDDVGKIVREVKVASEPEALLAVLRNPAYHFKRIGLEAGPLSQWLLSALAEVRCRLRAKGLGMGKVAKTLGIGVSYVQRLEAEGRHSVRKMIQPKQQCEP